MTTHPRGLPVNLDAERRVIGAMLLHSDVAESVSFLNSADFHDPSHRKIHEATIAVYRARHATDPIVVGEELTKRGWLAEVGGHAKLLDLMESVVTTAGAVHSAELVVEAAAHRRLIETLTRLTERAYVETDFCALREEAANEISAIVASHEGVDPIGRILEDSFARIDQVRERGGRLTGAGTDYYDLDNITGGLQPGELIVIGGRPSMGKTSLAFNIVQRVAANGLPCGVFALEMSSQQVIQNMLSCAAQVDSQALRKGRITDPQYQQIQAEAARLYDAPILICDLPELNIHQIRSRARGMRREHGTRLFVVDHLQLMSFTGRFPDRYAEQAAIVVGLKAMARELDAVVILVSQLNREVENRDDHRPRISDLRDCGATEDTADVVILLHRAEYYKPTEENAGLAELIVAKQRNGPTGIAVLRFMREYMRFENYTRARGGAT